MISTTHEAVLVPRLPAGHSAWTCPPDGDPEHREVLDVLAAALAHVEIDRADLYAKPVLAALPRAAHNHLEALMTAGTFPYQSRYARKLFAQGKAEGRAEGKAADVLMVLRCAATAESAPDVFA